MKTSRRVKDRLSNSDLTNPITRSSFVTLLTTPSSREGKLSILNFYSI